MYEVTTGELMVFVVLGFGAGIFASVYLSKIFEVVHMWRLVQEVVAHCLLMCVKIIEDISFLTELKRKHMKKSDLTDDQIHSFEEVDQRTLTNWKNSVILSLIDGAPKRFRTLMPFTNWKEAIKFLEESKKASIIERKKNYDL
jgi:hypothetical protein|tara:strand:+ start:436 stop:864 length:429 start_codon:yes stop_codon:yes gene_type:complete